MSNTKATHFAADPATIHSSTENAKDGEDYGGPVASNESGVGPLSVAATTARNIGITHSPTFWLALVAKIGSLLKGAVSFWDPRGEWPRPWPVTCYLVRFFFHCARTSLRPCSLSSSLLRFAALAFPALKLWS